MSQIYKSLASGPVPPSVATQYNTQDGNAVPAANILIVSADDTTSNDNDGIRTVGGGNGTPPTLANEVRIEFTNRLQGSQTSTNASNADIITFSLGASVAVYRFEFHVTGRSTAGAAVGQGVGYTVFGSARTDGATATVIKTAFQDNDEDVPLEGATMSFISSGNTIILRAVGIGGETIVYNAVGYYVVI